MEEQDDEKIKKLLKQVPGELSNLSKEDLEKWKSLAEIRELNKRFYQKPIQLLQIILPLLILGLTWLIKGGAIKEYLDVERIRIDRNRLELEYKRDTLLAETTLKQRKLDEQEKKLKLAEDSLDLKKTQLFATEEKLQKDRNRLYMLENRLKEKGKELELAEKDYESSKKEYEKRFQEFYDEKRSDSLEIESFIVSLTADYEEKRALSDSINRSLTETSQFAYQNPRLDTLVKVLDQYLITSISFTREKLAGEVVQTKKLDDLSKNVATLSNGVSADLNEFKLLHKSFKLLLAKKRTNKNWGREISLNLLKISHFGDKIKSARTKIVATNRD